MNINAMISAVSLVVIFLPCSHHVNILDQCDTANEANVEKVFPSKEIDILLHYSKNNFDWIKSKMKYVNCSARGLPSVPNSMPHLEDIQILDLSFNALTHFGKNAFSIFTKLVALSLSWNCPKNPTYNIFYCKQNSTILHENAFVGVTQLKFLDLSNNILKVFPRGLPSSIQYLDISSTAIFLMSFETVSFLTNLVVVVAQNICPADVPDLCPSQHIKLLPDTFGASNHSLKVLNFAFNNFFRHTISTFSYPNVIALNLAQTRINVSSSFAALRNVKYLQLNFLYPNQDTHVRFLSGTFTHLTKLEVLYLSNNKIGKISKDLFRFNRNLTFLELSGNCLDRDIQNPIFLNNLRYLKYLYLGFNHCSRKYYGRKKSKVSKLKTNTHLHLGSTFTTLKSLEFLSFGIPHDGINSIPNRESRLTFGVVNVSSLSALEDLVYLHTLNLAHCNVNSFSILAVANLTKLVHLDISNNFIENLTEIPLSTTIETLNQKQLVNVSAKFQSYRKLFSKIDKPLTASGINKMGQVTFQSSFYECDSRNRFDLSSNKLTNLHKQLFLPKFSSYSFTSSLDFSSNLIVTVRTHCFKNWKHVCSINLKNNPLRYIHDKAFDGMDNLKYIFLNNTKLIERGYSTVKFLNYIKTNVHLQMTNGHFFRHFKATTIKKHVVAKNAIGVDLSGNEIISRKRVENAFLSFPHVTTIKLRSCQIPFINFKLPNKLVTYLDLSDNRLRNLPSSTLRNMPKLKTLFLSKNILVYLYWPFAELVPNLVELDLSYNRINFIAAKVFNPPPNNLTKLWLNDNYLTQVSVENFSKKFLQNLLFIDLRWNAIGCNCKLTETFGWWLSYDQFLLQDRPGFVPICTNILDYNFGGCAKCQLPQVGTKVSFLKYSCNKSCQKFLPKVLCSTFFFCNLLLLLLGYVAASFRWPMLSQKVVKNVMDVIGFTTSTAATKKAENNHQVYDFHAFVCFDLYDQTTGDWIDNCLVPNIDPCFRVAVNGRDNSCGTSPTMQLLYKLEASQKTLVILSKNYGLSENCKYVISALEHLECYTGINQLILIIFQTNEQVERLLVKRRLTKPLSVLRVPEEEAKMPIFWKCLNAIFEKSL